MPRWTLALNRTGPLVIRLTNDVAQVQDVVLIALRILVCATLLFVGSLIMAVATSPRLALILLVLDPFVIGLLVWAVRRSRPLYARAAAAPGPAEHRDPGESCRRASCQGFRAGGLREAAVWRPQQQPHGTDHLRNTAGSRGVAPGTMEYDQSSQPRGLVSISRLNA